MKDITLILQACDPAAIITALGIDWERRKTGHGHELYFRCYTNNHSSHTGKFNMNLCEDGPYKGLYNCWSCGERGNIVHLINRLTTFSYRQALEWLEQNYGIADVTGIASLHYALRLTKPTTTTKKDFEVLTLPEDYTPLLKASGMLAAKAAEWLIGERNITEAYIEKYQIGWGGKYSQLGFGIVIPIVFCGRVVSFFHAQPFTGGAKRYPKNSPQGRVIFNYDTCIEASSYIMVESILDAIKIESVTGRTCMACFTNCISESQLALLSKFEQHAVMPDMDSPAGWQLVDRMLPTTGKAIMIYQPPFGKDPGACSVHELNTVIENGYRYCDYESNMRAELMASRPFSVKTITKH